MPVPLPTWIANRIEGATQRRRSNNTTPSAVKKDRFKKQIAGAIMNIKQKTRCHNGQIKLGNSLIGNP
jgi:hypothetical protein